MIVYRTLLLVTGVVVILSTECDAECKDLRIKKGPLIYPCLSEIILQKGQNYTLTCKGNTELQFQQQHISEEKAFSDFIINNSSMKIFEEGFKYEMKLELYNIDQFAIGYYACSDIAVNISNLMNEITKEPQNTEHVSFIYIYVNGTDNLFAPMSEIVMSRSDMVVVECRPTTPDVNITLIPASSLTKNKAPKTKYSPKIGFLLNLCSNIAFKCQAVSPQVEIPVNKSIRINVVAPPEPIISSGSNMFIENETFSLICTVKRKSNAITIISWKLPSNEIVNGVEKCPDNSTQNNCRILTISNATKKDEGNYTCISKNSCDRITATYQKKLTEPHLNIQPIKDKKVGTGLKLSLSIYVEAYPYPTFTLLKNEQNCDLHKYKLSFEPDLGLLYITKFPTIINDTANYTLLADNGYLKNQSKFSVYVSAKPVVDFGGSDKTCVKDTELSLKCYVSGYPLPNVTWQFLDSDNISYDMTSTEIYKPSLYNMTAYLNKKVCKESGVIKCIAINTVGSDWSSKKLRVYDIVKGFGINKETFEILDHSIWVYENDIVTVECLASKYNYSNVTWILKNDSKMSVEYFDSKFSHIARLVINKMALYESGTYTCSAETMNRNYVNDTIQINAIKLQEPIVQEADDAPQSVFRFQNAIFNCVASGSPRPVITWYKDSEIIVNQNGSNVNFTSIALNLTVVDSTLTITQAQPENIGIYTCEAKNNLAEDTKTFQLQITVETEEAHAELYGIIIGVILFILLILIVYLTIKIKKEKRFRKELAAAGLLYFKEGVTKSINPDLGIDEQAELLPYKEEFEYPIEKLKLGKQLGAGAFGVVYKADARGIVNAEETTPVAVKMVKKTADNMYIKALASELKIMVHLGKHINIVNLLGACTKNVGKRELVVIVEYCRFGNIHNYLQRHRDVFIDQLDTDNKEKLGKVNRAYTSSSCGSTGAHSDYFGSGNTQNTDHTFLNTANTIHSARKNTANNNQPIKKVEGPKASEGYVQPEWRSNYESEYSCDGRAPRPLYSRDLLAWSFQIARGMEYLASRKVLHGDLAARNILLADDNIVKICDFGLAKSIYKNDEYQKKENALLPWKWLAVECMTDRIFSTQSDVWSFGIVLWELFTLAKTPYPNMHPTNLLQFLNDGHRLDKPTYADERVYGAMRRCWEARPAQRPSFSQLQQLLGTFLEDNVRNHYVDINNEYVDKNAKSLEVGQEDYLAMVSAPDYNNLVTPSPHHYVNTDRTFFPTTPQVDEEGYLQISPSKQDVFSPRFGSTEFEFDGRKLNTKLSEASCGSELTPMLTLNNLPARGSDSDHDAAPPATHACPRIDEETDEVFTPCIDKNAKNAQSAVSNPTYITFDNYEEKPKDIINYVNVRNGLVK